MYQFFSLLLYAMLLRCSYGQFTEPKRYHLSPEQMGLRPSNSVDEVPVLDLGDASPMMDDHLNTTALRLKLGSHFDPNMMSITRPSDKEDNASYFGYRRNRMGRLIPTGSMPEYLSKIDFKYLTLTNGSKLRTKISSKLKRKIQQFLWAYTACPVVYRWKDLGARFWPRYLKTGHCPQNISCSVPPGMTCRPSASTRKTLLFCRNYSQTSSAKYCHWIEMEYPVLSECSCSCASPKNHWPFCKVVYVSC